MGKWVKIVPHLRETRTGPGYVANQQDSSHSSAKVARVAERGTISDPVVVHEPLVGLYIFTLAVTDGIRKSAATTSTLPAKRGGQQGVCVVVQSAVVGSPTTQQPMSGLAPGLTSYQDPSHWVVRLR